jgi:dTDP-4-amino-4,6-dideoxygalactose transaminase
MFYIICRNADERSGLINHLNTNGIKAVFHYISLHKSHFYKEKHGERTLEMADFYSDTLVRLPFYFELSSFDIERISNEIANFYK